MVTVVSVDCVVCVGGVVSLAVTVGIVLDGVVKGTPVVLVGFVVLCTVVVGILVVGVVTGDVTVGWLVGVGVVTV